jgi:hypothetical protein
MIEILKTREDELFRVLHYDLFSCERVPCFNELLISFDFLFIKTTEFCFMIEVFAVLLVPHV